jgi:hypothetical protein
VYWLDVNNATTQNPVGLVMHANLDGTNATVVASGIIPGEVAVGGGNVYWLDHVNGEVSGQSETSDAGVFVPGDFTTAFGVSGQKLAWIGGPGGQVDVSSFVIGDSMTIWMVADGTATAITTDGTNAYWGDSVGVETCPLLTSCSPMNVWTAPANPAGANVVGITTSGNDVYFTETVTQGVYGCPISGCAETVTPLFTPGATPELIAVDGTSVYATTTSGNEDAVVRAAITGGPTTTIATGHDIEGLAVYGTCVYWTDSISGTVNASAK